MPSVSVIVAVYNAEPYIARCARSLFGQTLEDLEFVFIDDCTPDGSMRVLEETLAEYPHRRPQVKVYRMPRNSGQAEVRLKGLSLATGDYAIHCDSDDEMDPDACLLMYAEASAGDKDIVACDFRMVYPGGEKPDRVFPQASEPGNEIRDVLTTRVWGSLCCHLVRRSLLEDLTPPRGNMWEDMVIFIQASLKASRFGYVRKPLYVYYRQESSITMSAGTDAAVAKCKSMTDNLNLIVDLLADKGAYKRDDPVFLTLKYACRRPLVPYVHLPEYYGRWKETFPEVDRNILKSKQFSAGEKFWYVLIRLRLYRPWKKVSGALRSIGR